VRKIIKRTVLGLLVLLVLLAVAALIFPRPFLTVDSGPVNAEVIILLGGGSHARAERVIQLFKDSAAPRIIVSGYGDCEINRFLLINAGVPAKAIQLENQSRTTQENAQLTVKLLREQKVKRVIIVTSWYHSRRALACFEHYGPELMVYSRPSDFTTARGDRSGNRIGSRARLEYLKLLGYWAYYGVYPF
jgi:uncharacterized SAM-binding protein YcdF (DUF218 family)